MAASVLISARTAVNASWASGAKLESGEVRMEASLEWRRVEMEWCWWLEGCNWPAPPCKGERKWS